MNIRLIAFYMILLFVGSCSTKSETTENIRLGNFKNRPRGFHSVYMPNGRIALFIENDMTDALKIQNVRFFIGDKGNFSKPFRVMLYSVDTITKKPFEKLLPDQIIVTASKGNGWLSVDVSKYNLTFPKHGVFASMEWLPDDWFSVTSQTECQNLAYSKMKNQNKTWYCTLGMNWYQLPDCDYNSMISIDVK